MTPVRDFVFIWNIFEAEVFKKTAQAKDLFSCTKMAPDAITDSTYNSIKERYVDKKTGELKETFSGLFNNEFEDPGHEREVIRILTTEDEISIHEKNLVCRMITWRYRCNLFHGEKSAYY